MLEKQQYNNYTLSRTSVKEFFDISDIREKLHTDVYPFFIDVLMNKIQSSIDLFSINITNNIINLKIKKTSIKKCESYNHDSSFYYGIINNIMYDFISSYINCPLLNHTNINLFYSITTLGDNIVCIHL